MQILVRLIVRKDNVKTQTISTLVKFISKAGRVNFNSKKCHYRLCWEMTRTA